MNFTKNALNQFRKLIAEIENPTVGVRFYTTQDVAALYYKWI